MKFLKILKKKKKKKPSLFTPKHVSILLPWSPQWQQSFMNLSKQDIYYQLAYKFHIAMIMAIKQQRRYISKINFIQTLEFIPHRSYHEPDTERFAGNQPSFAQSPLSLRNRANQGVKGLSQLKKPLSSYLSCHHNSNGMSSEILEFSASLCCP